MKKIRLRKGTILYHGTSAPDDFTMPNGPAWFSGSEAVARKFVGWHDYEDARPRILKFRVTTSPSLALLNDKRELDELMEETGIQELNYEELYPMSAYGYDGWTIPDNYGPGEADIMILNPALFLGFVDQYKVEESMKPRKNPDLKPKLDELNRLAQTLTYYHWLKEHGLSWNEIVGIRREPDGGIGFKLKDGRTAKFDHIPFSDEVIFNRPSYTPVDNPPATINPASASEIKNLRESLGSFKYAKKCLDPDWCQGDCDSVSVEFLRHASRFGLRGILLAVDNPRRPFDRGHGQETGVVSHYITFFPAVGLGVDWTLRQFWDKCDVPVIQTREEINVAWKELPFGWQDARDFEFEVADSRIDPDSNPPATPTVLSRDYYHATPDGKAGESILKDGLIIPRPGKAGKSFQAPRKDFVYMSPQLYYAAIYALGGVFMGHDYPEDRWRGMGRYGYIFLVHKGDLIDAEPDEDDVGEMATADLDKRGPDWLKAMAEWDARPTLASDLKWAKQDKLRRAKDGEMAYQSLIGKQLLKRLYLDQKEFLMNMAGVNIANRGPVGFDAAWRLDKSRAPEIAEDGSNVLEIAERIK